MKIKPTKTTTTMKQEQPTPRYQFASMPSKDFMPYYTPRLTFDEFSEGDRAEVARICAEYGVSCDFVKVSPFQDDLMTLVLHIRVDDFNVEDYLRMAKCVNELDNRTKIYFECKTSMRYYYTPSGKAYCEHVSYRICDYLTNQSTLGHMFNGKVQRGRGLMVSTYHSKLDESCLFDHEFNLDDVVAFGSSVRPKLHIERNVGKRQCDTNIEPYECVVAYASDGEYLGAMKFTQTERGVVLMTTMRPLGGESTTYVTPSDWKTSVESFLKRV